MINVLNYSYYNLKNLQDDWRDAFEMCNFVALI